MSTQNPALEQEHWIMVSLHCDDEGSSVMFCVPHFIFRFLFYFLGGKNSLGFTIAADSQQMLAAARELCRFPVSPRLSLLPNFFLHLLQLACPRSSSPRCGLGERQQPKPLTQQLQCLPHRFHLSREILCKAQPRAARHILPLTALCCNYAPYS